MAQPRRAVVASLLTTPNLNSVEPFAYLKELLKPMSNHHLMSRLDELMPWNGLHHSPPRPDSVSGMDAYRPEDFLISALQGSAVPRGCWRSV